MVKTSVFKLIFLEFCGNERFSPSCNRDEAIVMTHAMYGRMKIGKCIESSVGNLGCKSDILSIMDSKCSNKMSCDVSVIDLGFHEDISDPCRQMLRYLEASYICQKGLVEFFI